MSLVPIAAMGVEKGHVPFVDRKIGAHCCACGDSCLSGGGGVRGSVWVSSMGLVGAGIWST